MKKPAHKHAVVFSRLTESSTWFNYQCKNQETLDFVNVEMEAFGKVGDRNDGDFKNYVVINKCYDANEVMEYVLKQIPGSYF